MNSSQGFDETYDIVVVGFGAAGAAAAITASDAGASVVLVEKSPEHCHTPSTRMSGGMVMTVTDVDAGARYLDVCASGMVPFDVSHAWAERAAGLMEWFDDVIGGLDMVASVGAEHPGFEGAEAIVAVQPGGVAERLAAAAGAGPRFFEGLAAAVARREIPIRWDTAAARLVQGADGRVIGLSATQSGQLIALGARKGVVLACGGYEFDEDLKRDHLRVYPVHFYGNPNNTGDGVRMAADVGASMWHMNQMIGRAIGHFDYDGQPLNFIIGIDPPGYVICDQAGNRFANEHNQALLRHDFYYDLLAYEPATNTHPRVPCYWFFDESRRKAGPLTYSHFGAVAVGLYDWSDDNSAEVEQGWIATGDTITKAAIAAGMTGEAAHQAASTVAAYNQSCGNGEPDPWGRPADTMVPIDEPPYYCVVLWPGGSNTTGGPRRDRHGRILDAFGNPISGLYGAGELGQASGLLYPSDGSNLSEALCFGQIAVEHALGREQN
ncbi:MAG: FAD-binding protein [bacterium]|nr:FAD-binding protein [bacterium]